MIVVFGSFVVDLITPVPKLPARGETIVGESYVVVAGGKGANQALAAAYGSGAGAQVAMIGTVGADAWGETVLTHLRAAGVDLSLVAKGREPTACGFISVDGQGQTQITVSPGANMETRAHQLEQRAPGQGDWLLLQMEVPLDENWRALALAKKAGARCVLNCAPAMPVDGAVLDNLDILVVNELEAELIGRVRQVQSKNPLKIAAELARLHKLICIVTLGEVGSLAVEASGRTWRIGAMPVDAVDTTGAGDAYVGYLVAALDRGAPLADAMHFASTGASLACTVRGAQTAYRSRSEVESRMAALAPAEELK